MLQCALNGPLKENHSLMLVIWYSSEMVTGLGVHKISNFCLVPPFPCSSTIKHMFVDLSSDNWLAQTSEFGYDHCYFYATILPKIYVLAALWPFFMDVFVF